MKCIYIYICVCVCVCVCVCMVGQYFFVDTHFIKNIDIFCLLIFCIYSFRVTAFILWHPAGNG